MKNRVEFDIDRIIEIRVSYEKPTTYHWVESQPIKRLFGLLKPNKFTKEGFKELGRSYIYTLKELLEYDKYKHKYDPHNPRDVVFPIYYKAFVCVSLDNKFEYIQYFDTNELADEWVVKLKEESCKNFETIYSS